MSSSVVHCSGRDAGMPRIFETLPDLPRCQKSLISAQLEALKRSSRASLCQRCCSRSLCLVFGEFACILLIVQNALRHAISLRLSANWKTQYSYRKTTIHNTNTPFFQSMLAMEDAALSGA